MPVSVPTDRPFAGGGSSSPHRHRGAGCHRRNHRSILYGRHERFDGVNQIYGAQPKTRPLGQTGETLPLWYAGDDEDVTLNTADPAAATKAGLTERPLSESIRAARPDEPVPGFLSPEREADLLAEWSTAQPGTT